MASVDKEKQSASITLRISGLVVPGEKKPELEKSAQKVAEVADSLGYMDPLDEALSLIFEPKI